MAVMPFTSPAISAGGEMFTLQMIDELVEKMKGTSWPTLKTLTSPRIFQAPARNQTQTSWMNSSGGQTTQSGPGLFDLPIGSPTSLPPKSTQSLGVSSGPGDNWGGSISSWVWHNTANPGLRVGPGPVSNSFLPRIERNFLSKILSPDGPNALPDRPTPRFTWKEDS